MSDSGVMNVGVIGCGRMGRYHARAYAAMPRIKLAGVYDADPAAAAAAGAEFACPHFTDLEEMLKQVRAVTVAVPTVAHADIAERCLSRGVACLVEKPLAATVDECWRIVAAAEANGATLAVGHIERFNPAFRALERSGLTPRFIEASRISPLTFRSIDVGVVMDMMIHDLDLILKLAASRVNHVEAVGVSVIGGVEDICNARIGFANGCVANVTASRLALKTERKMRIFSADAYVSLDFQKREGVVARQGDNVVAIREAVRRLKQGELSAAAGLNFSDLVKTEPLAAENADPLRSELEAFVLAVESGTRPAVTGDDGMAAVDLAQRIIGCMQSQELGANA